jgi:GNAT superfamily N-acetyltransferase
LREPLTPTLLAYLRPLIEANHAAAQVDGPLCPDYRLLETMNPDVWVARDDGRPVGYVAHIISPHPHTQEVHATCLAVYLEPAHRMLARRLIRQVEEDLAGRVAVIAYSVPHLSAAGAFFEAIGYECRELVMARRLAS